MSQLHLLPSWNAPWAVLPLLAWLDEEPDHRHHVAAWRPGVGQKWLARRGIATSVLHRRWSWDPAARWRWRRLVGRGDWKTVHVWGGLSEGAAGTLAAAPAETVVLHALRSGDLQAALQLASRTAAPRLLRLSRPWYAWAGTHLPGWQDRLQCAQPRWPALFPQELSPWQVPPAQASRLEQLLAPETIVVLGFDEGGRVRELKDLLWAADVLCTAWGERLRVCFTGPCRPKPEVVRFWAALRTRDRIGWLPWPLALSRVLPRANALWWNDAEDLTLLLPRQALRQGIAVLGWPGSLHLLATEAGGAVHATEQDPYALAAATHAVLERRSGTPPATLASDKVPLRNEK